MLEPLARVPGSATGSAPNMPGHEAAWRALEIGLKTMFGILEGGGRLRTIRIALKDIGDNENEITQLVNRMMFDPELAAHLLTRKTSDVLAPAWNDKLAKLLRRVQAGRAVWSNNNNADQKQ